MRYFALLIAASLSPYLTLAADDHGQEELFVYDDAQRRVEASIDNNPEYYDIDIDTHEGETWATWLEFIPGQGDVINVGSIKGNQFFESLTVVSEPGRYARPRIVGRLKRSLRLTYEVEVGGQWDVILAKHATKMDPVPRPLRISESKGPDINHRTALTPNAELWTVWQGEVEGRFQILARSFDGNNLGEIIQVSDSKEGSAWSPDVVCMSDGRVIISWDEFDGWSYNVYARSIKEGKLSPRSTIAATDAFEANARLAVSPQDEVYIAWEEGGRHWGHAYTSSMRLRHMEQLDVSNDHGPLHRHRKIHIARLGDELKPSMLAKPLPMPSFDEAAAQPGRTESVSKIGVYYERPMLTFDERGRLWVVYRHRFGKYLGVGKKSHIESDWAIDARCYTGAKWSELYRMSLGQGDGSQSLALAASGDTIHVAWTTGRTDRRKADRPRGIAWASIKSQGEIQPIQTKAPQTTSPEETPKITRPERAKETVAGQTYQLYYGDLHRHTDWSLCYVPYDGNIQEAYRYGSDVAQYDFLGVTDHSRDIALANVDSQLWWRSVKEVTRHDLSPRFIPLHAYERSRGGEDHNVITLRTDILRPHTYPHAKFWKELGDDTITIPHQTITTPWVEGEKQPRGLSKETWDVRDNAHRPLIEIFQGCRNRAIEDNANEGLLREHLVGFIASSDHLSTRYSYACVWAEEPTRESLFHAMKARRTFGATAKIELAVTAGDHWMGERFKAEKFPPIHIRARSADESPFIKLDIILDGETVVSFDKNDLKIDETFAPPPREPGFHYLYVRLTQKDGHHAWSSPIWIDQQPPGQASR